MTNKHESTHYLSFLAFIVSMVILIHGCSASKRFDPLPEGLDLANLKRDTMTIQARHFEFDPEIIHVKLGTLLHVNLVSTDGTHGFGLSEFGIDEQLEENTPKSLEIYFPEKGEYSFRCSHFCGLGHFGMTGKIIVD